MLVCVLDRLPAAYHTLLRVYQRPRLLRAQRDLLTRGSLRPDSRSHNVSDPLQSQGDTQRDLDCGGEAKHVHLQYNLRGYLGA